MACLVTQWLETGMGEYYWKLAKLTRDARTLLARFARLEACSGVDVSLIIDTYSCR